MAVSRKHAELFLPSRKSNARRAQSGADNPALQAIWDVIGMIPRGKVSTYGAIASAAGLPGRARLTGYALRMMGHTAALPWHRVMGAGGHIVFPKSSVRFREQCRLLRAEGVAVRDGRVARSFLMEFESLDHR
jgi:methylated-DNA-protein-cysteine methyltransferase-like protein